MGMDMEMEVARSSIFDYFDYFAKFWQIATKLKREISLCSRRDKSTFISSQVLRTLILHFSQSEELIHSKQISNQNVFWLKEPTWTWLFFWLSICWLCPMNFFCFMPHYKTFGLCPKENEFKPPYKFFGSTFVGFAQREGKTSCIFINFLPLAKGKWLCAFEEIFWLCPKGKRFHASL